MLCKKIILQDHKEDDANDEEETQDKNLMASLLDMKKTADEKTKESHFRLFTNSQPLSNIEDEESEDENLDEEKYALSKSPTRIIRRADIFFVVLCIIPKRASSCLKRRMTRIGN